jgi:hypothetical protein
MLYPPQLNQNPQQLARDRIDGQCAKRLDDAQERTPAGQPTMPKAPLPAV